MSKKFVITFAGDTSLGNWYVNKTSNEELIQRLESHPESFFEGVKPIIKNSDYFIINLETVLADEPTIYFPDKKYPNWDKSEPILEALKSIGVTAVNLANNHTMDFGPEMMLDTKDQLEENQIQTFGAGNNLHEAERPLKITLVGEKNIKNIYIIGGMRASKIYQKKYNFFASDDKPGVNPLNFNRIYEKIQNIRNEDPSSFIILFPHWQGIDYKWASETKEIRELCSKFIENGVNYIIGHGPHIINDFEKGDSAIVAYSIGNFVWNAKGRYQKLQAPPYSSIARLQFKEEEFDWSVESRFYPIVTDNRSTDYQSRAINESEYENLIEVLSSKKVDIYTKKNPFNFWHGKDSIGFYISPNGNKAEPTLSFQNQNTDEFNTSYIAFQNPNDYKNQAFSTYHILAKEFEKKGYASEQVGKYLVVHLSQDDIIFNESESSYCSSTGREIAKDKTMAKEFLKKAGLNVAKGQSFSIHEKEKALAYSLSLPASVIKPNNGNKGKGVSIGVKTREEFEYAWKNATLVTNNKILIEEQFISGTEARYLVIGGRCKAVLLRIPPNIVGNGVDTIEELIKQKNKIRLENPNLRKRLIQIDKHRLTILRNQGYDLSSVPDKGVHVTIDWKGGLSSGGDSLDITDETHPLYKKLSEKAANSISGLDIVGVDILASNHFQKPEDKQYIIVEVNTRPGIGGHHFPMYGKPRNVAKNIAEYCINRALKGRHELIITKETLIEAIGLTKNFYFKNVINKNGKYIYSYLPKKNVEEKKYNILRHAGTTYSILETYELMPDEELLKIAESAINFFINKVKDFEINGNLVSAAIEKDAIKLGGNALGIIMLAKYTQVTGNYKYLTLMQRMARWICETQDKSGEFIIHKKRFSTNEVFNFTSQYYPGEAILSLVRLYQIDGNEDWLNCAELAAHYLIKVRDKDDNIDTIIHDHWLLYALNELYKEHPRELYFNHILLVSKSIIKSQVIDNKEHPNWNGAYRIPHIRLESTPTACRSEGLCAAYSLFHDNGYDIEASTIKTAIEAGIRFQLQTQLRPESAVNYKNKNLCLGAFQRGLKQYDLRIDFTQHNISSIIAYYKILSKLD